MDITEFYKDDTSNTQQKTLKSFIGKLVNDKSITLREYEYCIDYIDNDTPLKNGKLFTDIMTRVLKTSVKEKGIKEILKRNDCDNLIKMMKEEREKVIYFVDERINTIRNIFEMIHDHTQTVFGMYGYAGTGKTTLIMEIILFLITHKLINSVAFSAPTHKALNVMKTNFNKLIPQLMVKMNSCDQGSFDSNLIELRIKGVNIEFMTIHKLLGYSMEFNDDGAKVFAKRKVNAWNRNKKQNIVDVDITKYDVVIVDECSMISMPMVIELFAEIRTRVQHIIDINKIPKIIFTGDPAQLPPVNEKASSIFIKKKDELRFIDYAKAITMDQNNFLTGEALKSNYDKFTDDVINMKTTTLKQIFRNSHSNVIGLCFEIRQWVMDEITKPSLGKYSGGGVSMYRYNEGKKTDTKWFKKCVDLFRKGHTSNIILTWTNHQSETYNTEIRKLLLNRDTFGAFEIGDILILNDFYCFADDVDKKETINEEDNRFYTSEQLKIVELCTVRKKVRMLSEDIQSSLKSLGDSGDIIKKLKLTINKINEVTKRDYKVWKMKVLRLSDNGINSNDRECQVYVVHESSAKVLRDDNEQVAKIIKILLTSYKETHPKQLKTIEKIIMKPLWKYWNDNFVAPFASVAFGYSITTHKSEGSTFNNVFVDADDILLNMNEPEAKRCIYTSHTRCANELHILI